MTGDSSSCTSQISGKVAAILNARELAINVGSRQGVTVGMKFKILAESPIRVLDPDSGEELGVIDREKVRVRAVEVQEGLAVCKTYRTHVVGGGALSAYRLFEGLAAPPRRITETLKADSSSFPPPLPEEESYVKRGDRVIQLTSAEVDSE